MIATGVFYKPSTVQNVAFLVTAVQVTNAFGGSTRVLRIVATENCYYKVGANPTATASDIYLPAGTVEYIAVAPGEKISAIREANDGTLNITEMTK